MFPSKSREGVVYEAAVYFGGALERPNVGCSCERFRLTSDHWCSHVEALWNDMNGAERAMAVHHDEIYQRMGWHDTRTSTE